MPRLKTTEDLKDAAVCLICPGYTPMIQASWLPKGTKPTAGRLRTEVLRRAAAVTHTSGKPRSSNWLWQRCVDWLSTSPILNTDDRAQIQSCVDEQQPLASSSTAQPPASSPAIVDGDVPCGT